MLLIMLAIFLINITFLIKNPVLNQWIIYSALNFLNELIQTKGDISIPDDGITHAGNELVMVGNNTTSIGINSHTVHNKIDLSQFINHQQSTQNTVA